MGNPKRWFVDNGSKQGFLPADILNPIGDEDMKAIHAYDDVAEEESVDAKIDETEVNAMENNSSEILSKPEENACHESTTANNTNNDDSKENDNKKQQIPVRKAPPVPSSQQKQSTDPSDQRSNHSYEEIAASEVASEVRIIFDLGTNQDTVVSYVIFHISVFSRFKPNLRRNSWLFEIKRF